MKLPCFVLFFFFLGNSSVDTDDDIFYLFPTSANNKYHSSVNLATRTQLRRISMYLYAARLRGLIAGHAPQFLDERMAENRVCLLLHPRSTSNDWWLSSGWKHHFRSSKSSTSKQPSGSIYVHGKALAPRAYVAQVTGPSKARLLGPRIIRRCCRIVGSFTRWLARCYCCSGPLLLHVFQQSPSRLVCLTI